MGDDIRHMPIVHKNGVQLTHEDCVAIVTFSRPTVLNAIDNETLIRLNEVLRECEANDSVRAVVLAGDGLSFCAGIDLSALAEERIPRSFFTLWEETMWLSETLPKPVISAIHGNCIGAGLQLALTCDLRIAARNSRFALPAAKEGLIPSLSPHRLWRFVGLARARRMVFFDEHLSCETALEAGLVDELVDERVDIEPGPARTDAESAERYRLAVRERAVAKARELAESLPTISFAMCKKALSLDRYPDDDMLASYLEDQERCLTHPDHRRAADAWLARTRRAERAG